MSTVHKVLQLWRPGQYIKPHDAGPRIGHLFGAGQQGGVYLFDKAHQASAFQGGAYDTPLSAVEQFIGSFYDLSGNANHCAQTTSTARAKWSARVNLHTDSEFQAGYSVGHTSSGNLSAGSISGYAGAIIFGTGFNTYVLKNNYTVLAGLEYVFSVVVQMTDGLAPNFAADNTPQNDFALVIGTNAASFVDPRTYLVVNLGSGMYRVSGRRVVNANSPNIGVWKRDTSSNRTFAVTAYDLRLAGQSYFPHQRVNTATDYDTAGFPPYLLPDGADDYYTSASGGGSTTGIFICAAIAPLAAGAKQVIWSDASGNTGYELCINASNQVEFSAGTGSGRVSCVSAALSFGAPKVITAQHDGTNLTVRVDGVATTAACGAASAGTAGTTLLRANGAASSYAKVQINGLVQRHGAQPSAEQLTFAERYMANLQGRTL